MPSRERKDWALKLSFALFLLLVLSLSSMRPLYGSVLGPLTPTDLVFPFLLVAWTVTVLIGALPFRWHSAYFAFGGYLAALFVSAIFSVQPSVSFGKFAGECYLVALAVTACNILSTVGRLRTACLVWVAASIIPGSLAIFATGLFYSGFGAELLDALTHHYGSVPVGNYPRVSSTFITPSMFCNYLTVAFVLLLAGRRSGWIGKWQTALIGAVLVLSALSTVSIALGGLILAAGWWVATSERISRPLRFASLSLAIAAGLAFLAAAPIELSTGTSAGSHMFELPILGTLSPSSRVLVWTDAIQTFLADPLTGKGLGTAVANVLYRNLDGTTSLLTDAHNTFLNVAAQAGIPGLVALIAVIIVIVRSAARVSFGVLRSFRTATLIAFTCAFVYDGLTGSFENARHLWVLIGMLLAADLIDSDQTNSH